MCGIIAYTGNNDATSILLDGLRALEYRGYDSAGVYFPSVGATHSVGEVENLAQRLGDARGGHSGVAHTRWATHGVPNEANTHPHSDCTERIWVVHNGIIENYKELRAALEKEGHIFHSDTDSEVIPHLIESHMKTLDNVEDAFVAALDDLEGTYGIAVSIEDEPGKIFAARMGSPIVLGVGSEEYFVASDISAIVRHTNTVVYLNDGEILAADTEGYRIFTSDKVEQDRSPEIIESDVVDIQKSGYEHFMLKEIMEAPDVLENSARGRIFEEEATAKLGGIEGVAEHLKNIQRIVIVGCGSAYYAGMVGKYMIEEYAQIPVEVEIGSEFRYQKSVYRPDTAVLAISQSGETADTLASIREARRKGMLTLGIVNVVGSTIARETDAGIYNHAGPEISVASTKAFLSQLEILALLTLFLGRQRNMSVDEGKQFARALRELPQFAARTLEDRDNIHAIAKKYASCRDFLFIGRKYNFAIAYEGALKLKEVSYVHAEGYGAGEMKHGPLAMIDESFPTIAIVPRDSVYEKTISNIEEIRARAGKVVAIATEGDTTIAEHVDDVIYIPHIPEFLSPILTTIPLQLLAYYIGVEKGYNVDRPRNLAKSVTVE